MMITAGVVIWNVVGKPSAPVSARPPVPVPTAPVTLEAAPSLGSAGASVVMLIFSDFECPFCARFAAEVMPPLKSQYVDSGKVRFAFRHLPLAIHRRAVRAAESAECAARQGRFWAMHDSLFQTPMRLDEPELETHARKAGLDLVAFAGCMTGAAAGRVAADSAIARDVGLMSTPSVIIGVAGDDGTVRAVDVIVGVRPVKEFGNSLDRALAKARKL
jgi:protein-disulfide isomerase